ncbi:MAG: PepSY domain-containing protein, partial [FCB group bacterium]|nr:PepSY domain-containing protein [FCB group bacterium]
MKMNILQRSGICLILLSIMIPAVLLFAGAPQDKSGSIMIRTCITELPSLAKISYQDAVKTALAKTPGGVLEVELEDEHGYLVFCVEVVTEKGEVLEYVIDAGTGAILGIEEE